MLETITKKDYAEICWPNDLDMQKYIEKKVFEVIPLLDGYAAIDKSDIETNFCFGYGWNGVASTEDHANACKQAEDARCFDYFKEENMRNIKRRIENLESALNAENGLFDHKELCRLCIIAICERKNLRKYWDCFDSSDCYGVITSESIIEGVKRHRRIDCRPATREEIQALLDAEKRQAAAFEKRLNTWWKRYGAEKLHTWSYLVD